MYTIMKGALGSVLIVLIGIILLLILKTYLTAGFILCFTVVTILYSYNFFSSHPEENRLKVFWHGHFFVLISGYLSLWYAVFQKHHRQSNKLAICVSSILP